MLLPPRKQLWRFQTGTTGLGVPVDSPTCLPQQPAKVELGRAFTGMDFKSEGLRTTTTHWLPRIT
jgi:hypothetical protein